MQHAIAALFLAGCADQGLQALDTVPVTGPILEVSPASLDFGEAEAGTVLQETITLASVGDAGLTIEGVDLTGDGAFQAELPEGAQVLAPGASLVVPVTWTATGRETDEAVLHVWSDDPASAYVLVPLTGRRYTPRPELQVTPSPYDFGRVHRGCERSTSLVLENVGDATLELRELAVADYPFTLGAAPPLPFELEPGEATTAEVIFQASTRIQSDEDIYLVGALLTRTNEEVEERSWSLTGSITNNGEQQEAFLQGDGVEERADVLFWIDASCSMQEDANILARNAERFADLLAEAETDFQVGVLASDGCAGAPITPDTADIPGALDAAFRSGVGGTGEDGLRVAAEAAEALAGGCNATYERKDSPLSLVLISDEPDQSPDTWSSYVERVLDAAPDAVIHTISGVTDGTGACNTAETGWGYQEAAEATGGLVMDFCADWGEHLDLLGQAVGGAEPTDTFVLTHVPDLDTLAVEVDGTPSEDWSYDAGANAIVFAPDAIPDPGSLIEVSWSLLGDCDG